MNEEVVVYNTRRYRKQIGLLVFLFQRTCFPFFRQKVVVWNHHRLCASWAQLFPLVATDFAFGRKLQFRGLHSLDRSILGLEFRINDTAAVGLIDRKRLGSDAVTVLEYAEGTSVNLLSFVFLLFLRRNGSGRSRS